MARHVVSSIFSFLYSIIAIFLSIELWRMYVTRANLRGYKAAYNYLTICWALLRTLFWAMFVADVTLPPFLFNILFWIPITIQYLTFSLLAMFLLNVAFAGPGRKLAKIRSYTVRMLAVVGLLSMLSNFIFAALAAFVNDNLFGLMDTLGNAIITGVLTIVFGALAVKIRSVAPADLARTIAARPNVVSGVIVTIMLVFLSRSLYNCVAFAGYADIDINQDDIETDLSAVLVYTLWEFFPLILLASTLAAAPRSSQLGRTEDVMPTFGVFGAIQALEDDGMSGAGGSEPSRSEFLLDASEAEMSLNDNISVDGGSSNADAASSSIAATFVSLLGGGGGGGGGGGEKKASSGLLRNASSSGFLRGSTSLTSLRQSGSSSNLVGSNIDRYPLGGGSSMGGGGGGGLGISGGLLARTYLPLTPGGPFSSPNVSRRTMERGGGGDDDDDDDVRGISMTASILNTPKR